MLAVQHSTYATKTEKEEQEKESDGGGEGEIILTGELCKTLINSHYFRK